MDARARLLQDNCWWSSDSALSLRFELVTYNIDHVVPTHAKWLFENFSSELDDAAFRKAVAFWLRCVDRKKYLEIARLFGVSAPRASQLARSGFVHLMLKTRPYQMSREEAALFQQQPSVLERLENKNMDPKACLDRMEAAIDAGDEPEAYYAYVDYWAWRNGGGYEPEGGDDRCHRLATSCSWGAEG